MKRYVVFGVCFLLMSTAATLLLTWSLWWLFVVPDSVPARRSFFRQLADPPQLIADASSFARNTRSLFVYSLAGGWPTLNSALRITATVIAMIASLSFALIATVMREKTTRIIFTFALLVVSLLALSSSITDSVALHKVRKECAQEKCTSAIPSDLSPSIAEGQKDFRCECTPDAWFWVTLSMDYVLSLSAITCLGITIVPFFFERKTGWRSTC